MVGAWLLGNFDSTQFVANVGESQDRETGNHFSVTEDSQLTGLRWYRASGDADQAPVHLRVWEPEAFALIYEADVIPDDLSVGWQVHAVDGGPILTAHTRYMVTHGWQTHHQEAIFFLGTVPPPDKTLTWWLPQRVYSDGGINGLPNHYDSAYITGVDVQVEVPVASAGYTIAAETDYEGTLKWDQPADKYRLVMSTISQWQTAVVVETKDVRRITGFWQPIYEGSLGKRFQIDSPTFEMIPPDGLRMDGLLLDTSQGSAGHVQALLKV